MQYNNKDKDNNPLKVIIAVGQRSYNTNRVYCIIYHTITINLLLFKYKVNNEVYRDNHLIHRVTKWDCNDYEKWANESVVTYNKILVEREDQAKAKELIREDQAKAKELIQNGCNNKE